MGAASFTAQNEKRADIMDDMGLTAPLQQLFLIVEATFH